MRHSAISLIVIISSFQTILAVQAEQLVGSNGKVFAEEVTPMHSKLHAPIKTKAYATSKYLFFERAIHQAARRPEYAR